jgi:uncharacterized protein YciI
VAKFIVQWVFEEDASRRLEVRPEHRDYLAEIYERGKLVTSGPFADDRGALLIYEADDEAEVRDLLAADPYSKAEVGEFEIREWVPVFPPPAKA